MLPIYGSYLKKYARKLRKEMTDSERALWRIIRGKQLYNLQFYRQKPIGSYIVDFYCPSAKIIIELDGSQHFTEENLTKDKIRDAYLEKLGYKVLRFNDLDILKNKEGVIDKILEELKIPPNLPLQREGYKIMQLSEAAKNLKSGIYEHFKGKRYEVIGVAHHSETLEELVVYRALYDDGGLWVRPLAMFTEIVERDGKTVSRFKFIN